MVTLTELIGQREDVNAVVRSLLIMHALGSVWVVKQAYSGTTSIPGWRSEQMRAGD